jgi:branched-chain amino acid transport system substrate-binding protein
MKLSRKKTGIGVLIVAVVAGLVAAMVTPVASGAASPRVVTATNGTITVAGLGYAQNFGDAGVGAAARFQRANQDKEVKGYTFDYKEFADDKNDPATALSETRRLVTQDNIFALVPNVSLATPGDYLTQQQIPWFGPGYDATYCPTSGTGFGFSTYGCLIPANPKKLPNPTAVQLKTQLATKGITKPTIALIGTDSESGKKSIQNAASTYTGAGWTVVYAKGSVPAPPAVVGDFSPYSTALLTSNNGKAPDMIYSSVSVQGGALTLFNLIKGAGYTGSFISPFYSNLLLKPLTGAYVFLQFAGYESNAAGVQQMMTDVDAFKPGSQKTLTLAGGYFAADMFIAAVKASLKSSKTLTSASVQKAASKMTYQIKGTVGPTIYPKSYTYAVQACSTLLYDADGTAFTIAQPFTCSTKTYPILPKFAN